MSRTRPSVPRAPAALAEPSARAVAWTLLALTLVAAVLRLAWLDRSPPGLNQDEAINAWNAQCLLRTGRDMVGARWPVFSMHSIGDDRTPLLIYLMIPLQALLGLGVVSMRLTPALLGVLSVPLMYAVGARLWGRRAGLVAAALLVANPWHVSSSRWAIDGSIVPFLVLGTLALMLAAGTPLVEGGPARPRPWLALLAGLAAGLGTYGYWAMRAHLPVFLVLAAVLMWGHQRAALRTAAGRAAAAAFVAGLALTFGPLAIRHFTDPAVAMRAAMTRLWEPGTPLPEIARRMAERYAIHFGPRFLFVSGDVDPGNAPADSGAFEWVVLPLMVVGLVAAVRGARRSPASALLLALVLAYPVGDLFARYDGVHAFRSSPGLAALVLLAAFGAVTAWTWLRARGRALAWGAAALVAVAALAQDARSLTTYFGPWRDRPPVYFLFHTDFMQACRYVKSRADRVDAVFWTSTGVNLPFAMTLVGLDHDPARWRVEPRDVRRNADGWEYHLRYGNQYFLYGRETEPYVDSLRALGRPVTALFVVRPREYGLTHPVYTVRGPDGQELLWVCEGRP